NFFKGININADRMLFDKLSAAIFNYLKNNQQNFGKTNRIRLNEREFSEIKKFFSIQELNAMFVKFQKSPVSLNQFIDNMAMEDFSTEITPAEIEMRSGTAVKSLLNTYVKNFIQNELLAREALKRRYDKLPEVEEQLKMWKEYYLSHGMMKKIFKDQPISDEEALQFFIKANKVVQHPDEVKIAEILTDNLETVQFILEELDKGADFMQLAAKYTMRDSLKARSGEFNFFSVSKNGELGKTASQMKVGEVYGPIKIPEGFSIIKLLDKREGKKIKLDSFEEAKDDIKNILRTEKMYKKLHETTAKLAADFGIQINETVLKSLKVSSANMLVMRRFGFGGQMMAFPYAPNFSSWFKVYERIKKSNLP
ncbi:MAG: peptidylprolyl isomerase, partial [Bacteroidota bacterium]